MKTHLIIILIFLSNLSYGQTGLIGKYVDDHINENTYIIFKTDSSFKYRYSFDLFLDIKCGQYQTKGDTIYLTYTQGINDTLCNSERIMPLVARDTVSRRPEKLYYKDDRLYELDKKNKIIDKTSSDQLTFKPPEAWGYRRKFYLFGPYFKKSQPTYYMVIDSKAKWLQKK